MTTNYIDKRHVVTHEFCSRCGANRFSRLDRTTGRYLVELPTRCPDMDRCEREMGFAEGQARRQAREVKETVR